MSHNSAVEGAWTRNLGRAARDACVAIMVGVLLGLGSVHFSPQQAHPERVGRLYALADALRTQAGLARLRGAAPGDVVRDPVSGYPVPGHGGIGMLMRLDDDLVVQISDAYYRIGISGVDIERCHVDYRHGAHREQAPVISVSGADDIACR